MTVSSLKPIIAFSIMPPAVWPGLNFVRGPVAPISCAPIVR